MTSLSLGSMYICTGVLDLQVDSIVLQPEPWVMTSKSTRQGPEGGGKGKLEVHHGRNAAGCVPINPRIGMADEGSAVATHALRHDSSPFWTGAGGSAGRSGLDRRIFTSSQKNKTGSHNDDIKQGKADLGKLCTCIRSST